MSYLIRSVKANKPSFRTVYFEPGFNVVLADRTQTSSKKDSRNGLGKSTLIEIIHFCLGANVQRKKGLHISSLRNWIFSLELTLSGEIITVSRSINEPQKVVIEGDTTDWIIQPKEEDGELTFNIARWNKLLGNLLFDFSIKEEKFSPTFRSLISYFIRRGKDAFSEPFENYKKQQVWNQQVNNAFLLDLTWEYAKELQQLKDEEKLLNNIKKLKKNTDEGAVFGILGSLGELEALKVQVERELREKKRNLGNFQVHPQYSDIEQNVNRLTIEIHELTNENIANQRLLSYYESSLEQEISTEAEEVVRIYENVGIELPGLVTKRLEDVNNFHNQIIENRVNFLNTEIDRIGSLINANEYLIREKTIQRAYLLNILQTHGALEEYTRLQELYLESFANLKEIDKRINELRKFEEGKSILRTQKEHLLQRALGDRWERQAQYERAITIFNENSQVLYQSSGTLIIDIDINGFQFNVDIPRAGSVGIDKMKIFCYDLMLAELWSRKEKSPNILIHDSIIYDGVDERQVALALELSAKKAEECGFQYICTLNSDTIPHSEFSSDFDFNSFVRLTLTDDTDEGKLLGIQF
ncbi:MAG: DUF2326 domain-containing protein [Waterburya sp.]